MAEQTHVLPASIRNGLKYLNNQAAQSIQKRFQQQIEDERQLAHTRKELIVGVFAARLGFTPQYEPKMEGQTPDWLFLDESTSGVDEKLEARLYAVLARRLPGTTIVSCGHRGSLARLHQRHLEMDREDDHVTVRDVAKLAAAD